MRGIAKLDRERPATRHTYLLKGLVRCEICTRKMQGAAIRKGVYYRCIARTLAPGSAVLADHPKTVNLREDVVTPPINAWLCQVFDPDNRDETVAAMVGAQQSRPGTGRDAVEKRLKAAEARLRRHQAAIEAGVDPAALVDAMNLAQAERQAAREELENLPESATIDAAEVYAMLDSLGDVERALNSRNPDRITQVYRDLGLQVLYDNKKEAVVVTASPRVGNVCVRGGT
ncbi:zinc ribbon domain-containing protein [Amycolatopsis pittospori]|uniref:zinc ribbon domain-containing protein n=1 Tax=Amycolatopsis pittospori TaxID=2749434 RepID=UPI001F2F48BC|nr:zinc ribbon domain-containing protein [Amycolatopsis pittospori]